MFKVNNRNFRTRYEIYSKLTIKTPGCSGIFIVSFEHISYIVLVFLLLTLSRSMPAGYLFTKVCEFQVCTEFLKVDLFPAVMRLELGTD